MIDNGQDIRKIIWNAFLIMLLLLFATALLAIFSTIAPAADIEICPEEELTRTFNWAPSASADAEDFIGYEPEVNINGTGWLTLPIIMECSFTQTIGLSVQSFEFQVWTLDECGRSLTAARWPDRIVRKLRPFPPGDVFLVIPDGE